MKKMKLSQKLIGGFLLTALLLLAGGVVGTSGIAVVKNHLGDFVNTRIEANHAIWVIRDHQQNVLAMEQSLVVPEIFNDTSARERSLKGIEDSWRRADAAWKQYSQLPRDEETDKLFNRRCRK